MYMYVMSLTPQMDPSKLTGRLPKRKTADVTQEEQAVQKTEE